MPTREGGGEGKRKKEDGKKIQQNERGKHVYTQFSIHLIVNKADRAFLDFILKTSLLPCNLTSA